MVPIKLSEHLAEVIVQAIHEVTGCPINCINPQGQIIASTDSTRKYTFHEAGLQAIQECQVKVVEEVNQFRGSRQGVNYPVLVYDRPYGAIGITGDPKEVTKYGFLVTKITEVFIKEQLLFQQNESKKQQMNFFIRAYLYENLQQPDYLESIREGFHLEQHENYAVILLVMKPNYEQQQQQSVHKKMEHICLECAVPLYTYLYPNEFIAVAPLQAVERVIECIPTVWKDFEENFSVGIGSLGSLEGIPTSYRRSKTALHSATKRQIPFQQFYKLDISLLLAEIPKDLQTDFLHQTLSTLDQQEKEILLYYFQNNANLKETASAFFVHGNTLQYKLDKIAKKTQLNPRVFAEAHILYSALLLDITQ